MSKYTDDSEELLDLGVKMFVMISLILVALGVMAPYEYLTKRDEIFTVKDKGTLTHGVVSDRNGTVSTDFMVYTTDNKAYKNSNTLFYWKWRSAELQQQIENGKTYQATVNGLRIGMFGMYPNILKIKEIKQTNTK